jgi:hypothetical protein
MPACLSSALPDSEDWLTAREAGALAKVTQKTLANWRSLGIGPPYSKLSPGRGGRVRYRRSDLMAWLEADRAKVTA